MDKKRGHLVPYFVLSFEAPARLCLATSYGCERSLRTNTCQYIPIIDQYAVRGNVALVKSSLQIRPFGRIDLLAVGYPVGVPNSVYSFAAQLRCASKSKGYKSVAKVRKTGGFARPAVLHAYKTYALQTRRVCTHSFANKSVAFARGVCKRSFWLQIEEPPRGNLWLLRNLSICKRSKLSHRLP